MKQKIRKTGEVVEVITHSSSTRRLSTDIVRYIDSKGIECDGSGMNYYWDFEELREESEIDWEQRRYELSKIFSIELIRYQAQQGRIYCDNFEDNTVKFAVRIADKLIKQLKET